jgi:lipopolysaccharide biosynthesis regulator YciM
VFGLPAEGEREFLGELGLDLREAFTIGGEESLKKYLTKADGSQVGAQAMAEAMARMAAERASTAGQSASEGQQMPPERTREQQRLMSYQLAEAVVARRA